METALCPIVDPASRDDRAAFPLDNIDLSCVSNESLVALLDSAPIIYKLGETTVVRLSKELVMKGGGNVLSCEAKTLKLIESNSCIRTPRVHRSFQLPDPTKYFGTVGYIVMDYISGQSLDKLWRDLTNESRLDIASQTARMILELQSIEIQTPGPINGGPCRGRFFTDYSAGPFKNKYEMEDWFNHKLDICKKYNQASPDVPPFRFTNFVLTHQDISPRNLILDRDGLVWLVDWADAGAYPPAFESAALSSQQSYPDFSAMVLSFIPSYPTDHVQLQSIAYGLKTAAFA